MVCKWCVASGVCLRRISQLECVGDVFCELVCV